MPDLPDLILPLRAEFFHAIKDGTKLEEFRLFTPYWRKRIEGKTFRHVVLTLGYPARDDHERRLVLPWQGCRLTTIEHAIFGPAPVRVYAINVAHGARLALSPHSASPTTRHG